MKEALRVQAGFIEVVGKHLGKNINPLGLITHDQNVVMSIKRQLPIIVSDPNSITAREIGIIARAIIDLPKERKSDNILARIFSKIVGD
jgi:MinD-like ATPase involved in chromosome partitioning or flagellar assembly